MKELQKILDRIVSSRKDKRYTQAEVAARLGLERSTYARKELGMIPITLEEMLLIADLLELPVTSFFVSVRKRKTKCPKA